MKGTSDDGALAVGELETVLAAARVGWLALDAFGTSVRARGLGALLDLPDGDVEVATLATRLEPTDAARLVQALTATVHGAGPPSVTVMTRPQHGRRRMIAAELRRIDEPRVLAIAVLRDRTDDQAVRDDERVVRASLDGLERFAQAGTWVFDLASVTLSWSPGVYRIHLLDPGSYTPTAERGLDLVHPDDRRIVMQMSTRATIEGTTAPFDCRILRPDGSERIISTRLHLERDAAGAPIRMLGSLIDVTERRQLEKMLADAQRTDALGRMAGGIAHDFNNLLAAMTLGLAMARRWRGDVDRLTAGLAVVDDSLRRAGGLAGQLLAFSRRQPLSPRVLRPDRVLEGMEGLLRRLVGERVTLVLAIGDEPSWPIKIDPTQLEQVVLNLVVNARDALVDGGSSIRVELRNVPPDPATGIGPQIEIAVVDDGAGMSRELQARIFDPFFTTKRAGEGTGLGLATCTAIVQQARGSIAVVSAPGAGSRFTVHLPRSLEPLPAGERTAAPAVTRSLNVLVIDDDDAVRGGIVHELEWQGHAAMAAASADEAFKLVASFPGRLDLILTDVLLGRDDGVVLARELARRVPDARILLVTGFVPGTADATLPFPVLAKPFTSEALAAQIAEVIAPVEPAIRPA